MRDKISQVSLHVSDTEPSVVASQIEQVGFVSEYIPGVPFSRQHNFARQLEIGYWQRENDNGKDESGIGLVIKIRGV